MTEVCNGGIFIKAQPYLDEKKLPKGLSPVVLKVPPLGTVSDKVRVLLLAMLNCSSAGEQAEAGVGAVGCLLLS